MTSPCSVSLSRPSTEPGRLAEDRPVRRAAATTDGAAAAVEQRQLDALAPRRPSTSAACARWSIQAAARNPDSLFESE